MERIKINLNSVGQDPMMGDLESLSSLTRSATGQSLFGAVTEFIDDSHAAQDASRDPEAAEKYAVILASKLADHLTALGFEDVELLMCQGFKETLKDCSSVLKQAIHDLGHPETARNVIQFVVSVNQAVIIDLAFQRLGDNYMRVNNSPRSQFNRYWTKISSVGMVNNTVHKLMKIVRAALRASPMARTYSGPIHGEMNGTAGGWEEEETGVEDVQMTSLSAEGVVSAFKGAKRNRRLRKNAA